MTLRSSMREMMRISREHFGHMSGSASQTFLISSRHLAEGMRRGLCSVTSITSMVLVTAGAVSTACLSRWPRQAGDWRLQAAGKIRTYGVNGVIR